MHPISQQIATLAKSKFTYQQVHQILGHIGDESLCWTADKLEWEIPNKNVGKCVSCPIAKTHCKKLNKVTNRKVSDIGKLMCSDISSVKTTSYGGSKFWLLIVDCFTKMKWSFFIKHKDDQYNIIINFIKNLNWKQKRKLKNGIAMEEERIKFSQIS